jgi:hypothetical protein
VDFDWGGSPRTSPLMNMKGQLFYKVRQEALFLPYCYTISNDVLAHKSLGNTNWPECVHEVPNSHLALRIPASPLILWVKWHGTHYTHSVPWVLGRRVGLWTHSKPQILPSWKMSHVNWEGVILEDLFT